MLLTLPRLPPRLLLNMQRPWPALQPQLQRLLLHRHPAKKLPSPMQLRAWPKRKLSWPPRRQPPVLLLHWLRNKLLLHPSKQPPTVRLLQKLPR